MIWIAVIAALIVLSVFGVQSSQNTAINLEETVEQSYSTIQTALKRRGDLLPNLVDCVKQYDKPEAEVLQKTVEARGNNITSNELKTLLNAVHEAYPQLQSNTNYQKLMTELALTENQIMSVRNNYNGQIKDYNRYVRSFPARLFLSITGYEIKKNTHILNLKM